MKNYLDSKNMLLHSSPKREIFIYKPNKENEEKLMDKYHHIAKKYTKDSKELKRRANQMCKEIAIANLQTEKSIMEAVNEYKNKVNILEKENDYLKNEIKHKNEIIKDKSDQIDEKNEIIKDKSNQIKEKNEIIKEKDKKILKLKAKIKKLSSSETKAIANKSRNKKAKKK